MNICPYETFSIKKEEDLNFRQFHITARYTITSTIKCQNLYEFSKENKFSFLNLCVAAIYKTLEDILELKQYIIDGECSSMNTPMLLSLYFKMIIQLKIFVLSQLMVSNSLKKGIIIYRI